MLRLLRRRRSRTLLTRSARMQGHREAAAQLLGHRPAAVDVPNRHGRTPPEVAAPSCDDLFG